MSRSGSNAAIGNPSISTNGRIARRDVNIDGLFGGAVAQLGARLDGIEEVVGSNPISSTKLSNHPLVRSKVVRFLT